MAKINVHIWHDTSGRIVAVGRPTAHCKAVPIVGQNTHSLAAEIDEKLIADLHRTHKIDVKKGEVVPHTQTKNRPSAQD